jgi:hypothetical protein
LVIDDVEELAEFYRNTCFNKFVESLFNERIVAVKSKNNGMDKFLKMILNSSYGYDGLRTERYDNVKFVGNETALLLQSKSNFMGTRYIKNNLHMVKSSNRTYTEKTCLQCAFFTLDYAKYWYLNFIYNFLYKCCAPDKFHFVEGDTDSIYIAISGDSTLGNDQSIENIIVNKDYYNRYKNDWISNEKELLKVATEKYGSSMIALASKNYYIATDKKEVFKAKGVSNRTPLYKDNYLQALLGELTMATNIGFRMIKKNGGDKFVKLETEKKAITGIHNKMVVLKNHCCAPFVYGKTSKDYAIV